MIPSIDSSWDFILFSFDHRRKALILRLSFVPSRMNVQRYLEFWGLWVLQIPRKGLRELLNSQTSGMIFLLVNAFLALTIERIQIFKSTEEQSPLDFVRSGECIFGRTNERAIEAEMPTGFLKSENSLSKEKLTMHSTFNKKFSI